MKNKILNFLKKSPIYIKKYSVKILLIILILLVLSITPIGKRNKTEKVGSIEVMCRTNKIAENAYLEYQKKLADIGSSTPSILESIYLSTINKYEYNNTFSVISNKEYRLFFIKISEKLSTNPLIDKGKCRCIHIDYYSDKCEWIKLDKTTSIDYLF